MFELEKSIEIFNVFFFLNGRGVGISKWSITQMKSIRERETKDRCVDDHASVERLWPNEYSEPKNPFGERTEP